MDDLMEVKKDCLKEFANFMVDELYKLENKFGEDIKVTKIEISNVVMMNKNIRSLRILAEFNDKKHGICLALRGEL